MADGQESSAVILNTVEKAELMAAVGREIERIDRLSASNGYTSWALWAALGVIGWKVVELLQATNATDVGLPFLLLLTALGVGTHAVRFLNQESSGRGRHTYFRVPRLGRADTLRATLYALLALLCLAIQVQRGVSGTAFWLPVAFFAVPTTLLICAQFLPSVPVADSPVKQGPLRLAAIFLVFWMTLGVISFALLAQDVDWSGIVRPTAATKVAVLLSIMTILVFRLARNVQAEERRTLFQRIETELTLSKIDVQEARDRYENLMLGMSVSTALRPWVDAVMIPLDEANAGLSEVKQLLSRMSEANVESGVDNKALEVAVGQRASTLLKGAEDSVAAAGKAQAKLKSVCSIMFVSGEVASEAVPEIQQITDAMAKVRAATAEVRKLLPKPALPK